MQTNNVKINSSIPSFIPIKEYFIYLGIIIYKNIHKIARDHFNNILVKVKNDICDESVASPLNIITSPSLIRRPSPGSRREWVCERRGAENRPGLAACDEAHLKWMEPHHRRCYMPSAPLLGRPVSSPCMHAGVLVGPGRERWGTRTAPARRLTVQDAGPYSPGNAVGQRRTKPLNEAAAPRAPDPRGERVHARGRDRSPEERRTRHITAAVMRLHSLQVCLITRRQT